MPQQKVPDINFEFFVISQLKPLFDEGKLFINPEYQRGDIWKEPQQIELLKSIINSYSIGVLVLFINDNNQFEILDGQQRLITIRKYLNDEINLTNTEIVKYSELELREKTLINAYSVYYLKLKSHDPETKEEDIIQTFLRLQEGIPLNKAEKINAHRGEFKNTFRKARDTSPLFNLLGPEKRFRLRQLAAEMLLIELEGDFDNMVFPGFDIVSLIAGIKKYEKIISRKKTSFYFGNLDIMHRSLNIILTAFKAREVISFYFLISYLRKKRADNSNILNEIAEFAKEFLKNLYSFSIYDDKPPKDMDEEIFNIYKSYKQEAKFSTSPKSLKKRFQIILDEFKRLMPYIKKDPERFHDTEQKRILYFKQKGKCLECGKNMNFKISSAHHGIAHSRGGKTDDLANAMLLHKHCHERLEKRLDKIKQKQAAGLKL